VQIPSPLLSADQLLIHWDPDEKQVLIRNRSERRRVQIHRWGCLPKVLEPGNQTSSDCRVVVELREHWLFVSPDPEDDWRFDFDPADYLEVHPETAVRISGDLRPNGVTPIEWVTVYMELRGLVTDVHRQYLAAWQQRELTWPPQQVPDRVEEMSKQEAAAYIPIHPSNFGRRITDVADVAAGHFSGHEDRVLDFLVDNKLLTFESVYPYLKKWGHA